MGGGKLSENIEYPYAIIENKQGGVARENY
jgi:hypothetical protein